MSRRIPYGVLVWIALGVGLIASLRSVGLLDVGLLTRGGRNIAKFSRGLFPPDFSVLETVSRAMVETLQIAFIGTMLGFILAVPFALAASPSLVGAPLATVTRLLLAAVRTVPSLLWAIVFVVAVGLGPAAGALGIALYSLDYMGKLFYEILESVDPEVVEAVRATGVSRLQLARYALLPESTNLILAQLLFMFDYNVRASSIIGFVGAGGVGFYLLGYIQSLQYDRLLTTLIVTFVVVVVIDRASTLVRRRFLLDPRAGTRG